MKPGRELDKQVAKSMGWVIVDEVDAAGAPDSSGLSVIAEIPRFSTDLDSAVEVWFWLQENHPWQKVSFARNQNAVDVWTRRAALDREPGDGTIIGESLAHAICLAVIESTKAY